MITYGCRSPCKGAQGNDDPWLLSVEVAVSRIHTQCDRSRTKAAALHGVCSMSCTCGTCAVHVLDCMCVYTAKTQPAGTRAMRLCACGCCARQPLNQLVVATGLVGVGTGATTHPSPNRQLSSRPGPAMTAVSGVWRKLVPVAGLTTEVLGVSCSSSGATNACKCALSQAVRGLSACVRIARRSMLRRLMHAGKACGPRPAQHAQALQARVLSALCMPFACPPWSMHVPGTSLHQAGRPSCKSSSSRVTLAAPGTLRYGRMGLRKACASTAPPTHTHPAATAQVLERVHTHVEKNSTLHAVSRAELAGLDGDGPGGVQDLALACDPATSRMARGPNGKGGGHVGSLPYCPPPPTWPLPFPPPPRPPPGRPGSPSATRAAVRKMLQRMCTPPCM